MSELQPRTPAVDQDDTRLAVEVVEQLLRLADIVRDRLGDALAEAAVNETRLKVLTTIADRGDSGCSQADLACVLHQAESSVCTLIERMKKDGLVHRFRSKVDRRKSFLMLTPEGGDQLEAALACYAAAATELASRWGHSTEACRRLLEDLLFAVERPFADAPITLREAA